MVDDDDPGAASRSRSAGWGLSASFRRLWAATAASNVGDGVRLTALPLLATSITTDARLVAGVAIADRLPWLLLILPGGALADRVDRRRLRIVLDAARAIVMAGLALLVVADRATIVTIWVVAALLASMEAIVDSSSVALVPATVDQDDLERAGSRLASTELIANGLIGPPVGGLLYGLAIAVPFVVDSASFAVAAVIMLTMSGRYAAKRTTKAPMRREILDGFRWFWKLPLLRNLALISTALGTMSFVGEAIFVLFARDTLGLSPGAYGLLLVPPAIGGVIGSQIAGRLTGRPLGWVLFVAILLDGLAYLTIAALHSPVAIAALLAVSAAGILIWNVLTLALRQRVVPDELLGRVGASYRFLVYIGMPIGALAGGLLANAFGVRTALATSGIALTAIAFATPYLVRTNDVRATVKSGH